MNISFEELKDYIFNYYKVKFCYGLVIVSFNDVIREGDGERVILLYKIMFIIYKSYGCVKYVYILLLFLVKVYLLLIEL